MIDYYFYINDKPKKLTFSANSKNSNIIVKTNTLKLLNYFFLQY